MKLDVGFHVIVGVWARRYEAYYEIWWGITDLIMNTFPQFHIPSKSMVVNVAWYDWLHSVLLPIQVL